MTTEIPVVSLVVALSCHPEQALACLEGIATQAAQPSFEVIVVADACPGLEPLLARLDGDVAIVRCEHRVGFAAAAWRGLEQVRGEVVVFMRDGAVPAAGWLAPLVSALEDPRVGTAACSLAGDMAPSVLSAPASAFRTAEVRRVGCPAVADQLVLGTLALALSQRGLRPHVSAASIVAPPAPSRPAQSPGRSPELTIVIPTLDAGSDRARRCLRAIAAGTDAPHEVVLVDNGSAPQGFSAPVNAGVRAARCPYVVIMNDDVEPEPGWWPPLRAAIDAGAPVAFPLTVDGAMRTDFAAWCFAISAGAVAEFAHGPGELFDPALVIWFQDTDLLMALQRAGRPPVLVRESRIRHGLSQTLGSPDLGLSDWVSSQIELDKQRFAAKHPEVRLQRQTLVG